ncbi:MAG: F0F1 ATP synthase subunit B [Candidatus Eisenbacteria bacterium]|nr:F0F1 ATP synthase subunit B [Candidatus Eisenbacteria bacterium]
MDNLLNISPGLAIWTIVSFLLFVILLRWFAWGPILRALERREERIAGAIESAERSRDESARLLEEQKKALDAAREEVRAMNARAKAEAEKRSEEIAERARAEAEEMIERARSEIGREEGLAIERVRREAVDIALEAATRLMERAMDDDDHRRMVEEFIARTAKEPGKDVS